MSWNSCYSFLYSAYIVLNTFWSEVLQHSKLAQGYTTELWPCEDIQSDVIIKKFRIICGFWKQLGNYGFLFSFKLHVNIHTHMLLSPVCKGHAYQFYWEKRLDALETLDKICSQFLPCCCSFLQYQLESFFAEPNPWFELTGIKGRFNWYFSLPATSSLTKRPVNSKGDTP